MGKISDSLKLNRLFDWWQHLSMTVKKYEHTWSRAGFLKVNQGIMEIPEAKVHLDKLNSVLEKLCGSRTYEIHKRETHLRKVKKTVPILIAQINRNEDCMFANEKFIQWLDFRGVSIVGKPFKEVLGIERYRVAEPLVKRVLKGEIVSYEQIEKVYAIGEIEIIYTITFIPEVNDFGKVVSFILVANDVTKYKDIEQQLTQAKERADVASFTKSAFLANMSHEIRTPLGAILSFSELMQGQEMDFEERVRGAEVIKRNGQLLSSIINDILDLSKVEAGKLEIEKEAVHFEVVVSEINSLLSLKAAEKGIKLSVAIDGDLPEIICTDPIRLRQILLNIVGNAIKFTQHGSVDIKISLIQYDRVRSKIQFLVKDTGKGIKPDHAKTLFEPFSQEDVSMTRRFGGTGLGLVLSRKLANSLGGDVSLLESQLDVGSTFCVTIDPGDIGSALFHKFESKMDLKTSVKESNVNFSDLKILLVDDSFDNQLIVKHLLKRTGASIETACNGKEGVEKALAGNFDLVLMDLQMPILDGYGAIQLLKRQGYTQPIIALTAHAMKEERDRCLQSGFSDHISKPVDRQLLIKIISDRASHQQRQ